MEKYSVLMTVYSGENPLYFKEAIESILRQTYAAEQIVISVDGSLTKELKTVINDFSCQGPDLFTVIYNKKRGNWYSANKGIEACRNEFIARMDSDDIANLTRCERQLKEFGRDDKLDIVGSFAAEFIENWQNIISVRKVPLRHEEIIKYARKRNPFNHPTLMYRKSKAVACGGYIEMKRCEDYDFVVRMIMNGAVCCNIPEALLYYRLTDNTYERRKNWNNTKGFVNVRYINWRRGFCSFWDFISLSAVQLILCLMPISVTKWFYQKILRK